MPHPLAHDVAVKLMDMRNDPNLSAARQVRAEDMGQAMLAFTQGLRGKLFNRYGGSWRLLTQAWWTTSRCSAKPSRTRAGTRSS